MKRNRKIALVLSGLLILLMGFISLVELTLAQASDDLPETVYACLSQPTQTTKVWGLVETDAGSYYLIGTAWEDSKEENYQEVLVYLNTQDTCRSLLPENDPVLSHYIPLNLARELALQRYTRVLQEQGGRDAYQQQLTDYLTSTPESAPSEFPPAYVWALEQLGIELPPESYEVLL